MITPELKFVALNNFVLSTFLGEEESKDKRTCKFWNPIFNHAMDLKDRRERSKGIGRYFPTKALLVDHMEAVANVKYAKAREDLDLWGAG